MTRQHRRRRQQEDPKVVRARAVRQWLAGELRDGATAGLVLDYARLHAALQGWLQDAEEGYVLPRPARHPGDERGGAGGPVSGSHEPDRAVAGKVIPDWPDDEPHRQLPALNWDAQDLRQVQADARIDLQQHLLWYQSLLADELAHVADEVLDHQVARRWFTAHLHNLEVAGLLVDAVAVHRLLAVAATADPELRRRRKAAEKRWRELILRFERRLGRRPPRPGRHDRQGRVAVESVDELQEPGRRRIEGHLEHPGRRTAP